VVSVVEGLSLAVCGAVELSPLAPDEYVEGREAEAVQPERFGRGDCWVA
jgi:hypothetical protein